MRCTRVKLEVVHVLACAPETPIIICTALCAILRSRWTNWCILFYFIQKLSENKMDPGRLCLPKSEEICNSTYLFHCFGGSECLRCLKSGNTEIFLKTQSLLIPQLWFGWNQSTLNTWKWIFSIRLRSSYRGFKIVAETSTFFSHQNI